MFSRPSLPDKPRVDPTADAVSRDRLEPHEDDTEDTGDEGRIHGSHYEFVISEIGLGGHPDFPDIFRLRSCGWCHISSEDEDAVESKEGEHESDTPCKTFLDRTDPDFFSFFEIQAHEGAEDAPLRSEKYFRHELKDNDTHEDEWDGVFSLEENEEKWSEREEEHDARRDAYFSFVGESIFITFFWESFYEVSVHSRVL